MPQMPDQSAMHAQQLPADHALGARAGTGRNAGAAGSHTRGCAAPQADGRASICNPQGVDGIDSLPDEDTTARQHGDELACAGVQLEKSDANPGSAAAYEGNGGLEILFLRGSSSTTATSIAIDPRSSTTASQRLLFFLFLHSLGQKLTYLTVANSTAKADTVSA